VNMLPHAPWLSWIIPLVGAAIVPLLSFRRRLVEAFSVIVAFTAAAFAFSMIPEVFKAELPVEKHIWLPILNVKAGVILDPLSIFMASVATGIGALCILYSIAYMSEHPGYTRYYSLMLLFVGGMTGLVMASNMVQLYIFWEVVGLCSCFLIGFYYDQEKARHAGLKAFIVTRVGDASLMIGLALLYVSTGTVDFLQLANAVKGIDMGLLTITGLLVFGGAIGKSAQVPLFVWLPDAMEGPSTVSALIHAATMVKAGVYLAARTFPIFSASTTWLLFVSWIGAITAFMAATMAMVSKDIKRVLAYSTMSQIGYMMTAVGIGTMAGIFASQFHLMSHAIFKALLFLAAGCIIHSIGTRNMDEMGGLKDVFPLVYITFLIGAFSLAGIPPFNGFWSKGLIILETINEGFYGLAILSSITAIITVFYTFRMLFLTFHGEKSEYVKKLKHIHMPGITMYIPLLVLAAGCIISGFLEHNFLEFMFPHESFHLHIPENLMLIEYTISFLAIVIGLVPAYLLYFRKTISPEKIVKSSSITYALYKLLGNGYFFDKFYYSLSYAVRDFAQSFRKTHTGVLSNNMLAIVAMMIILIILFITFGGV